MKYTKNIYIRLYYLKEDEGKIKKDPPEEFFNNYKYIGDIALKFKNDEEEKKNKNFFED